MSEEIDAFNKFLVGMQGQSLVILNPPRGVISKQDALVLAAWLVSMADPLGEQFEKTLAAVRGT